VSERQSDRFTIEYHDESIGKAKRQTRERSEKKARKKQARSEKDLDVRIKARKDL